MISFESGTHAVDSALNEEEKARMRQDIKSRKLEEFQRKTQQKAQELLAKQKQKQETFMNK